MWLLDLGEQARSIDWQACHLNRDQGSGQIDDLERDRSQILQPIGEEVGSLYRGNGFRHV
jgi:hypothetical protein